MYIQQLIYHSFIMHHEEILHRFLPLVEFEKIDMNYTFLWKEKSITLLYLCIENELWEETASLLRHQADSTVFQFFFFISHYSMLLKMKQNHQHLCL